MIQVTSARVVQLVFIKDQQGMIKVEGTYELITQKGQVLAKQAFNGYSDIKIPFADDFAKDVIDAAETTVEMQMGIQSAINTIKRSAEGGDE